jgi:hypothetical protein
MVLCSIISVLILFRSKNIKKISFEEGQDQDSIPALPGIGSQIPAVGLEAYKRNFSFLIEEMAIK